jgi:hypothetical protein
MNKVTPHLVRDLHKTLPEGTESYLRASVRRALAKYRKGYETTTFLERDQALSVLTQKLGRGLERFFINDISASLRKHQIASLNEMT